MDLNELRNKFPGYSEDVYMLMGNICLNITNLILLIGIKDGTVKNMPNFITSLLSLITNYKDDPFILRN